MCGNIECDFVEIWTMTEFVVTIVIPVYNEAENIERLYLDLLELRPKNCAFEFVFVDDGSHDSSWDVIKGLKGGEGVIVKGVRFTRNFGKEAAILAGLREASGDAVIVMDADGQHPPQFIPEMVKWWREGFDVVDMVKFEREKESLIKRWGAELFYWLFKKLAGLDLKNRTDFKLLSRKAVDFYVSLPERKRFFRGLISWLSLPTKEIYFTPPERETGRSSWSYYRLLEFSWSSIKAFSIWPLRLVMLVGALGSVFSFVMIVHTLIKKLLGRSLEGFPTVIIIVSFFSSLILLSLGIIGEYVGQIYEEVKRRPPYVIQEKVKVSS